MRAFCLPRTRSDSRRRHVVLLYLLCVWGMSGVAGCQGRAGLLSRSERVVLDSLMAAHEAMYDSATANIGFDRMACLSGRADSSLGSAAVKRLNAQAEARVLARHSSAERDAGDRGIQMDHPYWTPAVCRRVDSLWYARFVKGTAASRP